MEIESDSFFIIFFNWDSLHARLNSHYEAWSYKKKKDKKIKAYKKKGIKGIKGIIGHGSKVKRKHSRSREFHSLTVRGKGLLT